MPKEENTTHRKVGDQIMWITLALCVVIIVALFFTLKPHKPAAAKADGTTSHEVTPPNPVFVAPESIKIGTVLVDVKKPEYRARLVLDQACNTSITGPIDCHWEVGFNDMVATIFPEQGYTTSSNTTQTVAAVWTKNKEGYKALRIVTANLTDTFGRPPAGNYRGWSWKAELGPVRVYGNAKGFEPMTGWWPRN